MQTSTFKKYILSIILGGLSLNIDAQEENYPHESNEDWRFKASIINAADSSGPNKELSIVKL